MTSSSIALLSAESRAEIDQWIAKYPADRKQSAVMAALRIAQDQNGGWLTPELIWISPESIALTIQNLNGNRSSNRYGLPRAG